MESLSVVIPAYNEEDGIAATLGRLLAARQGILDVGVSSVEIIVVDDGSTDRTAEIVLEHPGVKLIQQEMNGGYGRALKTGFRRSTGTLLAFLDADGTYPPEHLPAMCVEAINGGAELVIASRLAGAKTEMPLVRRFGNWFYARLLSILSGKKVTDTASGMRVFRPSLLDKLGELPDGLNLTPVMSTRSLHEDVLISEIAVPHHGRIGRSKLSVISDGSLFLHSIIFTALSYNPVRPLGLVGLLSFSVAVAIGIYFLVLRIGGVTSLERLDVLLIFIALVAAAGGASLFSLGALSNYLVSLFYDRPIRQGLFGKPLFSTPLESRFGIVGGISLLVGVALFAAALLFGLGAWSIERFWLYLTGGSMFTIFGLQLLVSWVLVSVLRSLSQGDRQARSTSRL